MCVVATSPMAQGSVYKPIGTDRGAQSVPFRWMHRGGDAAAGVERESRRGMAAREASAGAGARDEAIHR